MTDLCGHDTRMRLLWYADMLDAAPLRFEANEELAHLLRDIARRGVEAPLPLDALVRAPMLRDEAPR